MKTSSKPWRKILLGACLILGATGDGAIFSPVYGDSLFGGHDTESSGPVLDIVSWEQDLSVVDGDADFETAVRKKAILIDIFPQPDWGHVDCAPVKEVDHTVVCIFNSPIFMNMALARASLMMESDAGFISDREHLDGVNGGIASQAEGHDIPGADLRRFWEAYQASRESQPPLENTTYDPDFLKIEEEFWTRFVVPQLANDPNTILIATNARDDMAAIVSHEILHAQYFAEPEFRVISHRFWLQQVTDTDREAIKTSLKPFYNTDDDDLVANEFQAYVLMHRAEQRLLKEFVPRYRQPLWDAMTAAGLRPIQARIFSTGRGAVPATLEVIHGAPKSAAN